MAGPIPVLFDMSLKIRYTRIEALCRSVAPCHICSMGATAVRSPTRRDTVCARGFCSHWLIHAVGYADQRGDCAARSITCSDGVCSFQM